MTTRRQFIGGLLIVVGSAGCATQAEDPQATLSPSPTRTESEELFADCEQVESSATARRSDGTPPIRSDAFEPGVGWSSAEWLVTTDTEREALSYSETADGIASVEQYVESTDLAEHTILIKQVEYSECLTFDPRRIGRRERPVALMFTCTSRMWSETPTVT
ncbi:hypothetical protein BRD05_08900 [Halobacteriales archaeon QS_9_70_65]|nr:MAG: hypothetical protein BRD05_08900 [Halobacteriales archaeon QS_9_70_65]